MAASSIGRVAYVSKTGLDTNDGRTPATAKLTITAALTIGATNVYVGDGIYVETVKVTPRTHIWAGLGVPTGFGTDVKAPADAANCIEFPKGGEFSGIHGITTTGSGPYWNGAGVLLTGTGHHVEDWLHQNLDGTATKDFGGSGLLMSYAEGCLLQNYKVQECRVGVHFMREACSSVLMVGRGSRCYTDLWIDGSPSPVQAGGAMPQGIHIADFKAVAGKSCATETPVPGTSTGYALLADAHIDTGAFATSMFFTGLDADETNQAGPPGSECRGLLRLQDSTLLNCNSSPEMMLELGGMGNVLDGFKNLYSLTVSGDDNNVRDLRNIGAMRAASFAVTGVRNRVSILRSGPGATSNIGPGNYDLTPVT